MIQLRQFQPEFVAEIREAMRAHRRVLAVANTGFGKTTCFSYIAAGAVAKHKRVLIAVHRERIVQQISKTLAGFDVPHGLIMRGAPLTSGSVQIGMVQTIARRLDKISPPELLIVDEAHHCAAKTYQRIFDAYSDTKILLVTATPSYGNNRSLAAFADVMVQAPPIRTLIKAGILADYVYSRPPSKVDFTRLSKRLGDYAIDELAAVTDKTVVTGQSVALYKEFISGEPAIAFCTTVAHAKHVAEEFAMFGVPADYIDGTMSSDEQVARFAALESGGIKLLATCDLVSEGVDIPNVVGCFLLRKTSSIRVFLQQIGRVLRWKGGKKAWIFDQVNNLSEHGLPCAPRNWSLKAVPDKPPASKVTQCDVCFRVFDSHDPAWRKTAACGFPPADEFDPPRDGCVLAAVLRDGGGRTTPDSVAGEMEIVTSRPAWAQGIDIVLASGQEWRHLLELAVTPAQLYQIAEARGYKKSWVYFTMQNRKKSDAAGPDRRVYRVA